MRAKICRFGQAQKKLPGPGSFGKTRTMLTGVTESRRSCSVSSEWMMILRGFLSERTYSSFIRLDVLRGIHKC